jgi:hypothetical protein
MKTTITGSWGCSERSKKIHFFVNGVSLCGRSSHIDYHFEKWDESNSDTCESCRRRKKLFTLGAVPAHNAAVAENA